MHNLNHGNDDGLWRSDSARRLAEKVANKQSTYDTLDVNINIDNVIDKRNPDTIKLITAALDAGMPFILHADFEFHAVIIPKTRAVATYTNGAKTSVQFCKTDKQFQNVVRMCVFVYPKFFIPTYGPNSISSGDSRSDYPGLVKHIENYEPVNGILQNADGKITASGVQMSERTNPFLEDYVHMTDTELMVIDPAITMGEWKIGPKGDAADSLGNNDHGSDYHMPPALLAIDPNDIFNDANSEFPPVE